MKIKTLILASAFSALALSFANADEVPASHAKMFSKVDTDASGSITTEEAEAAKAKYFRIRFDTIDTDGNGEINLQELSADITTRKAAKKRKSGEEAATEATAETTGEASAE